MLLCSLSKTYLFEACDGTSDRSGLMIWRRECRFIHTAHKSESNLVATNRDEAEMKERKNKYDLVSVGRNVQNRTNSEWKGPSPRLLEAERLICGSLNLRLKSALEKHTLEVSRKRSSTQIKLADDQSHEPVRSQAPLSSTPWTQQQEVQHTSASHLSSSRR